MEYPEPFPFLVDGRWRTSADPLTLRSPYDGREVAQVHRADAGDLEDALAAAARIHPLTQELPTHRRAAILRDVAARLGAEREPLARMLALEAGKPLPLARDEVNRAAQTFALSAAEASRLGGRRCHWTWRRGWRAGWLWCGAFPSGRSWPSHRSTSR